MGTDYTCTEKGNTDLQTLKKKKKDKNRLQYWYITW